MWYNKKYTSEKLDVLFLIESLIIPIRVFFIYQKDNSIRDTQINIYRRARIWQEQFTFTRKLDSGRML